ncbi:hypothetical protein [Pacificibacter marinus]|uniref:hypothetical protein n=1 Tax=Pacificibacter marinus TaxID=658057 RepID=UPI001C073916|nr:hypothetical protein [Pacificibacter marinus]MBU2867604.1 hypothetical protein [Pacificibacter marinus]
MAFIQELPNREFHINQNLSFGFGIRFTRQVDARHNRDPETAIMTDAFERTEVMKWVVIIGGVYLGVQRAKDLDSVADVMLVEPRAAPAVLEAFSGLTKRPRNRVEVPLRSVLLN